jgi:hypothetical protein
MKNLTSSILFVAAIAMLYPFSLSAQWSNSSSVNNLVSTAVEDQNSPQMISDGAGGAYLVWEDSRNGIDADIYVQRISAEGNLLWNMDGLMICDATGNQTYPQIIADGAGGIIVVWQDNYAGNYDIYAQRVSSEGVVQWTPNGTPVCTENFDQNYPKVVSDDAGGAIVVWEDNYSGNADIYVQRINALGAIEWLVSGVAVCTDAESQYAPELTSDGLGGAIIAWEDYRTGTNMDIYAQKVTNSGEMQWVSNGSPVINNTLNQLFPKLASDGANGAIFIWENRVSAFESHIHAQLMSASGERQWSTDGIPVSGFTGFQGGAQLTTDETGGAIIVFQNGSAMADVLAQRINSSGDVLWTAGGVEVCAADNAQSYPVIKADGNGGAFISWWDDRNSTGNSDVYAQHINSAGAKLWMSEGVAISTANGNQLYPALVPDGIGGALFVWEDTRGGNADIYAQNVCDAGNLGICSTDIHETIVSELQAFVFQDELTVRSLLLAGQSTTLSISDMSGRQLYVRTQLNAANGSLNLDVSQFSTGIYAVQLRKGFVESSAKVVIF